MDRFIAFIAQCCVTIICLGLSMQHLSAAPSVVVSIKPIHSLVTGVMQGIGKPELLVSGSQSPHTFSLRPSDIKKLSSADLIIWVGKNFEIFLTHPLDSVSEQTRILELMGHQGIATLPLRHGGVWDKPHVHPDNTPEQHQSRKHEEDHELDDPHIWLSPQNAREIITIVKEMLIEIDPENAKQYQINARDLKNRLNNLDQELLGQLTKVNWVPFVVFHDAYQYFERHYRLNAIGSITLSPERKPGAKRIADILNKLRKLEAHCVFSEPQFEPKLMKTIVQGTQVRTGVLDPLGADLPAGTEAYFSLMHNLTDNLVRCLETAL